MKLSCLKYYTLVNRVSDYHVYLAILDVGSGKIIAQDDNIQQQFVDFIKYIEQPNIGWTSKETVQGNYAISPDRMLNLTPLTIGVEEPRYWLCSLISSPDHTEVILKDEILLQTIKDVAIFIQHDSDATILARGMADELATRYEELNLLYGIDVDFDFSGSDSISEMYYKIIEDCIVYLGVDIVCLYLPDEDVLVVKNNPDISAGDLSTVLNKFQGSLYSLIAEDPETYVVNKDEIVDWTNPRLGIDYKYIAVPLFKSIKSMAGMLVIANHETQNNFTNSDRKLCEVLGAEISKFIQLRHDPLTGLLNRVGLEQQLRQAIAQNYEKSKRGMLLYIDIDQFKSVNEVSGHNAGDILLTQLASLLPYNIRATDSLARIGGDDFVIILNDCPVSNGLAIAEKIIEQIKSFRFVFLDKVFNITVSIGLVVFGDDDKNTDDIIGAAESACFTAKELGRNQVRLYEKTDVIMTKRHDDVLWVGRIHNAIEDNRFKLYRQRIISIQNDTVELSHYEILLRMIDEKGSVLSPFTFIPAAERYEQMTKLDRWVILKTLETLSFHNKKEDAVVLHLSINLSGQSLCEDGFAEFIINSINKYEIQPESLCFEVTETAAIINLSHAQKFMAKVKAIGCSFSLDDFGSGMSSFGYLKSLPVDYLKIDGQFVKGMMSDPVDRAMVESIHHIGHVMGLQTIAEFVEDDEMIEHLRLIGIDYAQGYALGRPEPFEL